jgi:hypothetical protein
MYTLKKFKKRNAYIYIKKKKNTHTCILYIFNFSNSKPINEKYQKKWEKVH